MIVIMGSKTYEMTRQQADGTIKAASRIIKSGVYAVEKDGVVELKKEIILGYFQVKKTVQEYRKQGFKVYYNAK